jgi:hypothetical protein
MEQLPNYLLYLATTAAISLIVTTVTITAHVFRSPGPAATNILTATPSATAAGVGLVNGIADYASAGLAIS